MTWTPIGVGTSANDHTGDSLRAAMQAINAQFAVTPELTGSGSKGLLVKGYGIPGAYSTWAQLEVQNESGGTHAGIGITNTLTSGNVNSEECAIGFGIKLGDSSNAQHGSYYVRAYFNNVNAATWHTIAGEHWAGAGEDYTTRFSYSTGCMRLICGQTASNPQDDDAPDAGFVHSRGYTKLDAQLLVGETRTMDLNTDIFCDIEGYGRFGDCDVDGLPANSVTVGYDGSTGFVVSQNLQTTSYLPLRLTATTIDLGLTGSLRPGVDDSIDLGDGSHRYDDIFATNTTIQTSDKTLKTKRGDGKPTKEEIAWAKWIVSEGIVAYFLKKSVDEKGGDARVHWGVFAQDVYDAGLSLGIKDPFAYGFMCKDEQTTKTIEKVVIGKRQKVVETKEVHKVSKLVTGKDGTKKAVLVDCVKVKREKQWYFHPISDNDVPVMVPDHPKSGEKPLIIGLTKMRQRMHREPVMEDVWGEQAVDVPLLNEKGEPVYRWGIRYVELIMFILASGALQTAA